MTKMIKYDNGVKIIITKVQKYNIINFAVFDTKYIIKIFVHDLLVKLESKLLLNLYSKIKTIIKTGRFGILQYKISKPSSGD